MNAKPTRRIDMTWRRGNLPALLVLTTLSAGALLAFGLPGRTDLGWQVPVALAKVQAAEEKIDPNTAPAASLERLPEIGPAIAERICQYRRQAGGRPFRCGQDLRKVRGIGPATVLAVAPHLSLPLESE